MKGIIFCECSQAVTIEFRKLGVECYSSDIKACTGGHPEWHIQGDALELMKRYRDEFLFMIGHPPCTHIAVSGAKHFKQKQKDGRQQAGINFFMEFTKNPFPHWCIENPVSIMSEEYRKPDEIIHPYFFGDKAQKATCLWLHNLPPLYHQKKPDLFSSEITHVDKGEFKTFASGKRMAAWYADAKSNSEHGTTRSVTFKGIAHAMAEQWTDFLTWKYKL